VRTYPTTEEHDLDLAAGRVDATLAAVSYFAASLEKPGGSALQLAGPLMVGGPLGVGVGVGLRKTDTDLKALLDEAIISMLKDGSISGLSKKWMKVDISAPL
ncbi:MAG TPA: transporter substrate-binding domain-containing protein, partial [Acetobacteraceae bacterium]